MLQLIYMKPKLFKLHIEATVFTPLLCQEVLLLSVAVQNLYLFIVKCPTVRQKKNVS